MNSIPTGTERMRPFVPAKDFDCSKRFYETLGFEKVLDGEVAIFNAASGGFILQRYYQKDWAENFMMQLMVDNLDAWWAHIDALDLPSKVRRSAAEAAGDAAMGPLHCICIRSVRCALACGAATRRDDPGRMKPAALSFTQVEEADKLLHATALRNVAREQ